MLEEAMFTGVFSGWQRVRVHALLVGNRIDLRALYRSDSLTVAPLAIPAGERGMAVLFRYGAVVMFNLQVVEEAAFLVNFSSVVGEMHTNPEREEAEIVVDPGGGERVDAGGVIHLREVTAERLLVVADVLAKSVVHGCWWSPTCWRRVSSSLMSSNVSLACSIVSSRLRRHCSDAAVAASLRSNYCSILATSLSPNTA